MNRFNQIFERGEYVPMVQPLPYEALAGFGAGIEKRADEDLAATSKLKELVKSIKYDPADTQYVKEFLAEYEPLLTEASTKAIKGEKDARKLIYDINAKWSTDPRINVFSHNYELGKQARESSARMKEKFNWSPKELNYLP